MNNLEPRAKIGDRVVKGLLSPQEGVVIEMKSFFVPVCYEVPISLQDWLNLYSAYGFQSVPPEKIKIFKYKDILKNLTTNISYEN